MIRIKKIARSIIVFFIGFRNLLRLPSRKDLYNAESYYPELKDRRKHTIEIFFDQVRCIIKYGYPQPFYFLYGFDIKGLRDENTYAEYEDFKVQRDKLNFAQKVSSIPVLRDKFLFGIVSEALHIPTPKVVGTVENGKVYILKSGEEVNFQDFVEEYNGNVFIKIIDGECGMGIFHVIIQNGQIEEDGEKCSPMEFLNRLGTGRYLIQESIINQHPIVSRLHPASINTARLYTIYNNRTKSIEYVPPIFRMGVGDMNIDNWAKGGIIVGVNLATGRFNQWGFYKPGKGIKTDRHPDSNIVFEEFEVPYWHEMLDMVKRFHLQLRDIHSIGWDVAITEDGPVIIEGNDNWEINPVQVCSKGLKDDLKEIYTLK